MLVKAMECSAIVTTFGVVLILLAVNFGIAVLDNILAPRSHPFRE